MKLFPFVNIVLCGFLLTSCSNYPRLLSFPFADNNRSFNSRSSELNPSISGQYITFTSDRNSSQDVFLFDAKNRRLIDLPGLNSLEEIASNPSISEDGRYLLFTSLVQGKLTLFLYDRTTQQKRPLITQLKNDIRNPMISSNGERITFEVANNGQWDIVVTDIKGKVLDIPTNVLQSN